MSRLLHSKDSYRLLTFALLSGFLVTMFAYSVTTVQTASAASSKPTTKSVFCANLGKRYQASSGAQMYCNGIQRSGPGATITSNSITGANVNAANPSEDVAPSGVRAYGQSEVSVAGTGSYVVEAWNDATSFLSSCGAAMYKEEGTGFGFSADGGKSFVDQGGLPNANCNSELYGGDPAVEAWQVGGSSYFYVSSLYNGVVNPTTGLPADARSYIAMSACKASGNGSNATIQCSQPIIIGASTQCQTQQGTTFCSFLDKDFLSIDPIHGRLYATYTEFGSTGSIVELAMCDIGTSSGGTGALGGTAGAPVCVDGGSGSQSKTSSPYFVVAPPDANACENEGAYPAVDAKTGAVYVAYEHNWATSLFAFPGNRCTSLPVQNVVNYVPFSCLTMTTTSSCAGPAAKNTLNVTSMQAAIIPGYSRFPMSDFPRIAVSHQYGTVSLVWNDARAHIAGDILMQSFDLVSLTSVQTSPVRINSSVGGWHMLPALRNANANGTFNISFYNRTSANSAITNLYAALNVNPRTSGTPANTLITTQATNWFNVSSDINPNFGDYTDNYVIATPGGSPTGTKVYIAWSDGRLGVPQPFAASH